jgi:hypothetical protein
VLWGVPALEFIVRDGILVSEEHKPSNAGNENA